MRVGVACIMFDRSQAEGCKDTKDRGLLLSGPPGVGKTSSAIMVAKSLGLEVVELNASVKRAKSDVKGMAEFVNTQALNFSGVRGAKKRKVGMLWVGGGFQVAAVGRADFSLNVPTKCCV